MIICNSTQRRYRGAKYIPSMMGVCWHMSCRSNQYLSTSATHVRLSTVSLNREQASLRKNDRLGLQGEVSRIVTVVASLANSCKEKSTFNYHTSATCALHVRYMCHVVAHAYTLHCVNVNSYVCKSNVVFAMWVFRQSVSVK